MPMKTFSPKPRDIERRWYVIDADGVVLGRLASEVAKILRGKHKPIFAPHMDTGDHVIVINARGVRVTGGKETKKFAYHHSGYPGGLRATNYGDLLSMRPTMAVEKAIKGMLPKNRLGRQMATKLQVYEGAEHPHQAQKPVALGLGEIPKWEGLPEPKPKPPPKHKTEKAGHAARERGETTGSASAQAGPTATRAKAGAARAKAETRAKAGDMPASAGVLRGTKKDAPAAPRARKKATKPVEAFVVSEAGGEKPDSEKRTRRSRAKKES
jgi:large subunit ribosomal protein L13